MDALGITIEPSTVMSTHKHNDHTAGNLEMKQIFPNIQILGGADDNVPGATDGLVNGQELVLHDIKIRCYHTPCHTRGHMLFLFEPAEGAVEGQEHVTEKLAEGYQVSTSVNRCVFTGDTIFAGGCGRFFEGEPHEMVHAMSIARDVLPPDTKMFCGHEYTVDNLTFCATADPENPAIQAKKQEA